MHRRFLVVLAIVGVALFAVPIVGARSLAPRAALSQWASSVDHSSQYGESAWSGMMAAGAPDVTTCGDNGNAWAAEKAGSKAFIDAFYDTPVTPTKIWVYQTYHPGAVTSVKVWDADIAKSKVVYTAKAKDKSKCPAILKINVKGVSFKVGVIRVSINQAPSNSWAEIDAVRLVGTP